MNPSAVLELNSNITTKMLIAEEKLLWEIEQEHLHEAEFLIEVHEAALDAPQYTLEELSVGPEQRLLAHVDALVIAGPAAAQRVLLPTIEREGVAYEKVVAAAMAMLAESDQIACARVLAVVDDADADEDRRRGVVRALQLSDRVGIDDWLIRGLADAPAPGVAARLETLAGRQHVPGRWLATYLTSDHLPTARAAAALARFAAAEESFTDLDRLARSEDPALRRMTLETALIRGVPGAWESALYWAFHPGESPFRRAALTWVSMLGDADVHERVAALVDDPRHRAEALWALSFGGRTSAVDRCMNLLANEEYARLAGEVVCAIAGLPTDEARFWRDDPPAPEGLPPLEADDPTADLVPPIEDSLPLPDPDPIIAWWQARRGHLDPTLRHLGGRPLGRGELVAALWHAPLRRRHALALELAIRSSTNILINTRGLCRVQYRQLRSLSALGPVDCQRGFPLR
ncbi:hypothetical protein DB30_02691 [Enhygromyxa salina]|uniref:TIGR02270 family protein n=1 Tax=Enhygromyxa salina TaxID=215803 RepID=A0A0C2DD99_9BACT|nr:TIGR02270 family protein [Enhygromyxa salina]KIG19410.1 hypothetical protein DB30_02691 [Enhygromyxa salina]